MKKINLNFFILITFLCVTFSGCEDIAELFHGPKPAVTYTVTFDANGASGTPPAMQTVDTDTVINLPDKGGLTSAGNIFVGWSEVSSGTDTIYSVGSSITVTRNMVFYAQWLDGSTPQYTLTFNANGATGDSAPAPQTVYSGISITIPGQGTLVYSGKTFGGWNTQSNGGGTNYAAGAAYIVKGNVTLYAKWQSEVQYTVTYHANGALGTAPSAQTVDPGTVITLPDAESMKYTGKAFDGWNTNAGGNGTSYAEGAEYTVNANTSFYAQWVSVPITPPGATLVEQLAYIRNNAGDGVVYDIVVNNNEYIGPQTVSTMGRNIIVNISSASPADVKTIQLEGQGHLFSVDTGITLKLQDIVLRGHSNNNRALVAVGNGTLILNSGAKITMNTNTMGTGGGIYVNGGSLELNNDSEISGNTSSSSGGGIRLENHSSVAMRGGLISENKSIGINPWAGGVFITGNSSVTMSGGIISKNTCDARGGGIAVNDSSSSFTKRAASGSSTSGIIYGSSGENANIAGEMGNVIYRNWGSLRERNTTLGGYDEISTGNDVGWE
jgi:uncharacterized repeat protein (TIGR02543 family)